MSPLRTLTSCGSSSSESRRMNWPTRVRRSAPSTPPGATPASGHELAVAGASTRIERNLSISNSWPSRPMRRWRKRIGPGELSRTASVSAREQRRQQQQRDSGDDAVERVLDRELPAARVDRRRAQQRDAAEVLDLDTVRDLLEQARHDGDLDAQLAALADHPEQDGVRRGREGHDDLFDVVAAARPARCPSWRRARAARPRRSSGRSAGPCRGSRSGAARARDARAGGRRSGARRCRRR